MSIELADLAMLDADPETEGDLRWLWELADGDLGLRSSFPAMLVQLETGGPPGAGCGVIKTELDPRALEAAQRCRELVRALEKAFGGGWRATWEIAVLRRGLAQEEARRLPALGPYAGAAVYSPTAVRGWEVYWARLERVTCLCPRTLEEWLVRVAWKARGRVTGDGVVRPEDRRLAMTIAGESKSLVKDLVARVDKARHREPANRLVRRMR